MADCYDVAVIGGGVVGCGVARACALAGRKTVLIEREAALAASHGERRQHGHRVHGGRLRAGHRGTQLFRARGRIK